MLHATAQNIENPGNPGKVSHALRQNLPQFLSWSGADQAK